MGCGWWGMRKFARQCSVILLIYSDLWKAVAGMLNRDAQPKGRPRG